MRTPAPEVMVAEAKPAKKKVVAEPKVETVAYAPPAAEPAESASSGIETTYYIQLGSFSDPDNAYRARDTFANVWPVQFIELMGTQGPVYRVRLGPISNQADADTALENAYAAGFGDARQIRSEGMQASLQ